MSHPACQVSIVIPMWNESENVGPLLERLWPVLQSLKHTWEVIVVDDGSTDDTVFRLREAQRNRPELKVLSFVRNFGQHAAVMAGFRASRGQMVITLDADLQNPPEEIPTILEWMEKGHDLVNSYRRDRRDPLLRRIASRIVNFVTRKLTGVALKDFGCMLRGYDRRVVDAITAGRNLQSFIPALATVHARRPVEIPVAHADRDHGTSKYSLYGLFRLNLDLLTTYSLAPLRALFLLGGVVAVLGVGLGILIILLRLVLGAAWAVEGVFTLFAILFFLVGGQFLAFGLLGEYIGRIYLEVRQRPDYILRDVAALDEASSDQAAARGGGEGQPPAEARSGTALPGETLEVGW